MIEESWRGFGYNDTISLNGLKYMEDSIMNYDKFINILENNKIKVIPIIKNKSEIKDIKFVPSFIEFIYREKNSEEKIKNIQNLKDIQNLAVGTILNKSEAKFCIDNGIKVMFSPHFDEELVKYCLNLNAILIPEYPHLQK